MTHLRLSDLKIDLLRGTHSCSNWLQAKTSGHGEPVGTSWRINLRIASGSCSLAASAKAYDRSKPFGPSIRIPQFSLPCDPAIDTRHSPGLSLSACSTRATIPSTAGRHRDFAVRSSLPSHYNFTGGLLSLSWCKPVNAAWVGRSRWPLNSLSTTPVENLGARRMECRRGSRALSLTNANLTRAATGVGK